MKRFLYVMLFIFCTTISANDAFLEADAKCLATKNHYLKQVRNEKIATCKKNKEFGDQKNACEPFYADFGNPLFDPMGLQIKKEFLMISRSVSGHRNFKFPPTATEPITLAIITPSQVAVIVS